MSEDQNDDLKALVARIAALEARLGSIPLPPAVAGPASPHEAPARGMICTVCGEAHQPNQCSRCARCKRQYGAPYHSQVDTAPCEACGSRGYTRIPGAKVAAQPPYPRMPTYPTK